MQVQLFLIKYRQLMIENVGHHYKSILWTNSLRTNPLFRFGQLAVVIRQESSCRSRSAIDDLDRYVVISMFLCFCSVSFLIELFCFLRDPECS